MQPISPAARSKQARRASLANRRGPDHPDTIEALRDFAAQRLEDHAREVARNMPPLSAEQRDRIVSILHGAAPVSDDFGDAA
jgi:hypothetical protein